VSLCVPHPCFNSCFEFCSRASQLPAKRESTFYCFSSFIICKYALDKYLERKGMTMQIKWVIVGTILVIVIMDSYKPIVIAEEDAVKKDFLAEYEPSALKLADYYSNLRMRFAVSEQDFPSRKDRVDYEIVYMANGSLYRLDSPNRDSTGNLVPGSRFVRVVTPELSFIVSKRANDAIYSIHTIDQDYSTMLETLRLNAKAPFAPYCFYETFIPELIKKKTCKIRAPVKIPGKDLMKLDFELQLPGKLGLLVGWMLFAPGDCWALQEYACGTSGRFPNEDCSRCVVVYDGKDAEIPIVKQVEQWVENREKRTRIISLKVLEMRPGPVPASEFTLDAFGIQIGKATSNRWLLLYVLLGILATFLALVFRYLAKRHSKLTESKDS